LIDLHCHILPGVDDGALDLDDSLGMARQAAGDGIEKICATPHIRHDHDVRIAELEGRVEKLNRALREERLGVEVLGGGEVAETAVEGLGEEELERVALGSGRWILLEPAPGPLGDGLAHSVAQLAERGHRALIAHPERHIGADFFERLSGLVGDGALVQATADFFLHQGGTGEGMRALAAAGLVHVLSSDAHSSHAGRPVHLSPAFEVLREVEGVSSHLEWMARTAPRAIVEGDELEVPFAPRF
jgi:protein-tyrosine phosphatase